MSELLLVLVFTTFIGALAGLLARRQVNRFLKDIEKEFDKDQE
jgi:hypothetical protein